MRSRYTAYALGDGDHLFRTWHPRTRTDDAAPDPRVRWTGLEVLDVVAGGPDDAEGVVEFRARWVSHDDGPVRRGELHERSRFARRAGRWVYVEAEKQATSPGYRGARDGGAQDERMAGDYEVKEGDRSVATFARSSWRGGGCCTSTGGPTRCGPNPWATSYTMVDDGGRPGRVGGAGRPQGLDRRVRRHDPPVPPARRCGAPRRSCRSGASGSARSGAPACGSGDAHRRPARTAAAGRALRARGRADHLGPRGGRLVTAPLLVGHEVRRRVHLRDRSARA